MLAQAGGRSPSEIVFRPAGPPPSLFFSCACAATTDLSWASSPRIPLWRSAAADSTCPLHCHPRARSARRGACSAMGGDQSGQSAAYLESVINFSFSHGFECVSTTSQKYRRCGGYTLFWRPRASSNPGPSPRLTDVQDLEEVGSISGGACCGQPKSQVSRHWKRILDGSDRLRAREGWQKGVVLAAMQLAGSQQQTGSAPRLPAPAGLWPGGQAAIQSASREVVLVPTQSPANLSRQGPPVLQRANTTTKSPAAAARSAPLPQRRGKRRQDPALLNQSASSEAGIGAGSGSSNASVGGSTSDNEQAPPSGATPSTSPPSRSSSRLGAGRPGSATPDEPAAGAAPGRPAAQSRPRSARVCLEDRVAKQMKHDAHSWTVQEVRGVLSRGPSVLSMHVVKNYSIIPSAGGRLFGAVWPGRLPAHDRTPCCEWLGVSAPERPAGQGGSTGSCRVSPLGHWLSRRHTLLEPAPAC